MTANELQDLISAQLVRRHGGSKRHWRIAIGAIKLHDRATHAHCNWSATPSGTSGEVAAIERLLDDIRATHPFVIAG